MTPATLVFLSVSAAALAFALFAALAFARLWRMQRGARTLARALDRRAAAAPSVVAAVAAVAAVAGARPPKPRGVAGLFDALMRTAVRGLDTRLGHVLVAAEDQRLLARCGFIDERARGRFFAARVALGIVLPGVMLVIAGDEPHGPRFMLWMFLSLAAGFMLPKMIVRRMAGERQRRVAEELPIFVDLLRLLQGVGLSLDQSLQVMVNDFATVMPVLAKELAIAHRQFTTGRTREQSLHRLATSFENDDLNAVVRLLVQVDRHGGAVQEPLRQFGDRLRESRRAVLRARIGKLTVKMTGVMVLTLLPALLIMTAGPGFLAVMQSLSSLRR